MKIYLGLLCAIRFIGEEEKEFLRAPFNPKPVVKKGDIIILEKIHAYNVSKLFPDEWEMISDSSIKINDYNELSQEIDELKSYVLELEEVVSVHDLAATFNEELTDEQNENNSLLSVTITAEEALHNVSKLKELSEFSEKEDLEAYALEEFGIELDKRKNLEGMYLSLKEAFDNKDEK